MGPDLTRAAFWLVAGPNGSGKSTAMSSPVARDLLSDGEHLDPDRVTRWMLSKTPSLAQDEANLRAARWTEARTEALIEAGQGLIVETVLSTAKYLPHVERAKRRGFYCGMLFVTTVSVELNVGRVAQRAAAGGHDVPVDKIRQRWPRSHAQIARFLPLLDRLVVIDGGMAEPCIVVDLVDGRTRAHRPGHLPEVDAALGLAPGG